MAGSYLDEAENWRTQLVVTVGGSLSPIKTESSSQVLGEALTNRFPSSTLTMATGDTEQGVQPQGEQVPLLGDRASSSGDGLDNERSKPEGKVTAIIWTVLLGVFAVGLVLVFTLPVKDWDDPFPSPERILRSSPVIDGHIGQFIPTFTTLTISTYHAFISAHATRLARTRSGVLREQRVCIQPQQANAGPRRYTKVEEGKSWRVLLVSA